MSKSIGNQIDMQMKSQRNLEEQFEKLIEEKKAMVKLVQQDEIIAVIQKIKEVAENLKKSTYDICKSLDENPDIPQNLNKAKKDKGEIKGKLEELLKDLNEAKFSRFNEIV